MSVGLSFTQLHSQYVSTLTNLLDTHAPTKETKLSHKPLKWFTPEVKEAKMHNRRLEHKWMRTKTPLDRSNYRR